MLALGVGCSRSRSVTAVSVEHRESPRTTRAESGAYVLRYDQLGYLPDRERNGVVLSVGRPPAHYRIVDASTQRLVAEGTAAPRIVDATSRVGTRITGDRLDLQGLPTGSYSVVFDDGATAGPIRVATDVYAPILPLVAQFLAEQRCGPTNVAVSRHGSCHLFRSILTAHSGDGVVVSDGVSPPYPTNHPVDAEGGWHDAGDYLKFAETTAYVLATELMALRDHRSELGAAGDNLAHELKWGLDWLLKMETGPEPYHQVGGEGDHDADWRAPEADTSKPIVAYDARPIFRMAPGRGRNILGRSAAAFVFGSQVFDGDPTFARKLLAAAKSTYALAKSRPGVQNPDPPDFYPEENGEDDLLFAAAALARATGEPSEIAAVRALGARLAPRPGTTVGWGSVDALALLEAGRVFPVGSSERSEFMRKLDDLAAPIAATARTPMGPGAGFGYALGTFGNGSIAESLGAAITCLAARRLSGLQGCDTVALRQLHWLFGQNPFGLSFLVGAGSSWPEHLHHALVRATHVTIPGSIAGGPTTLDILLKAKLPAPSIDDVFAKWSTNDLLYEDNADDYICNEPAIDFATGLVFTLAELGAASESPPEPRRESNAR